MPQDIVLLSPPWVIEKGSFWRGLIANTPSLALGYLAAALEHRGMRPVICDASAEEMSMDGLLRELERYPGVPWAGITTTLIQADMAIEVAHAIKQRSPATRVVMGGVHATVFSDELLHNNAVDYVVRNEGEQTLAELVQGKDPAAIQGLSGKKDGGIFHNPSRPWVENLDEIALPAYHLMPMHKSRLTLGNARRSPAVMLIGSRGCSFKCGFCTTAAMGNRFRFRSAENIIAEIRLLMEQYGVREIHFQDDSFTLNKPNAMRFCQLIMQQRIDLSWLCMANVVAVDDEVLAAMKQAGCHQVCFGMESGNEQILKNLNKNITLDQVRKAVSMAKKAGLDVRGSFMLGCPGETEATIQNTLSFIKELDLDLISVTVLTPVPGSRIFTWAQDNGYLMTTDWKEYNAVQSVMRLPTIAPERVNAWHRKIYRKFYLRPSFLLKHLRKIRSVDEIAAGVRAFMKVAG